MGYYHHIHLNIRSDIEITFHVLSRFIFDKLIILQEVLTVDPMRDLIDSSSEHQIMSPTAFIADLEYPNQPENLSNSNQNGDHFSGMGWKRGRSIDERTKTSEQMEKKRMAGLKSRQKKKQQVAGLEESVKQITFEIQQYDLQISKCKNQLVQAVKTSTNNSSQHSFTFSQLQKAAIGEDPDLDRINLLLDLIQNRIGANGKERQSKLQYNFKQIINSLFPATHRYFMHSAVYDKDVFEDHISPLGMISDGEGKWTKPLYEAMKLTQQQIDRIAEKKGLFVNKRRQTVNLIMKLKESKYQLKQQQEIFERTLSHIREDMNPVQSAQITLFGQKNKFREQFSLFCDQFTQERSSEKKIKRQ